MYTRIKNPQEIEAMRQGGKILANTLAVLKEKLAVGISTKELSDIAAHELKAAGAAAAFLGYQGFPEVLCVSLNDEVVHGIPKKSKQIANGDIVSMDLGVRYDGMIVDGAISAIAGTVSRQKELLLRTTHEALTAGIAEVRGGCHVGSISAAVELILRKGRYGIVRDLVGHGVGDQVHEDPNIPNYGKKGTGPRLESGMTIAIEPMATLGRESVYIDIDGWTVRTRDHSISAHFEHTVLITDHGYEILTEID